MLAVFGILLMVSEVNLGLLVQDPVVCKFNRIDTCYVAEGRRLHLPMPSEEKFTLDIIQNTITSTILKYIQNKPSFITSNQTWQIVTENRTLILNSAKKTNSGNYSLELFDSGTVKGKQFLQVNIEAQVSSVEISHHCLSPGVMKVSCSANGDNLHFKWTGDFNTLTENGSQAVELPRDFQGSVTCHVENHVSRDDTSIQLSPCPEPTTMTSTAITSGSLSKKSPDLGLIIMSSVCVLLIIISIVAFYIYKKTHKPKNKGAISQEGRELVYAQVTHFSDGHTEPRSRTSQAEDVEYAVVNPRASKKKQKTDVDNVQYGELVFDTPAKNHRQKPMKQDDCIYSQVQHHS